MSVINNLKYAQQNYEKTNVGEQYRAIFVVVIREIASTERHV